MLRNLSLTEFTEELSGPAPFPGGGGASALAGAIGAALSGMVGSLTIGKKKYAEVEEEMIALKERADRIREELLLLVDRDAEVFGPLSEAYRLPKETEEERRHKEEVMEKCLGEASEVPLQIMEKCCEAIALSEEFAEKGSRLAISDAGVSAALLRSALTGASLNVFINTGAMKNREKAAELEERAEKLLSEYVPRADLVFEKVRLKL